MKKERKSTKAHLDACARWREAHKGHYQDWISREGSREKCRKSQRAYRTAHKEEIILYMAEYHKKRWKEKGDMLRKENNEKRNERKKAVLLHYGGRCVCCGEDNPIFLTLDHVRNDGAAHRRGELDGKKYSHLWDWAFSHGFPDTLQLLCYNCNCAKGKLGYCPHETEDIRGRLGFG